MARSGSETRQRPKFVRARCTDDELAAIEKAAAEAGLSVAAYVRERTIGSAGPRTFRQRSDRVELCRLLSELGKSGSNVNQLAKVANIKGELPEAAYFAEVSAELRAASRAIMAALGRSPRRDGD